MADDHHFWNHRRKAVEGVPDEVGLECGFIRKVVSLCNRRVTTDEFSSHRVQIKTQLGTAANVRDLLAGAHSRRWPSSAASALTPVGRFRSHLRAVDDPLGTVTFLQSGGSR